MGRLVCITQLFIDSLNSFLIRQSSRCAFRMNHPIKRFKADDLERNKTTKNSNYDLYAGQKCSESSGLPNYVQTCDGLKNDGWKGDDKNPNVGKDNRSESDADKNSNSENLFTSEGLQPSYADLNKIFDNSDDNSNDDHVSLIFKKK